MPHCVIEFSSTLDISPNNLVHVVHQGVVDSGSFEPSHIKTRAIAYDYFQLSAEYHDFIHVSIHLHHGRTVEQKKQLTQCIMKALEKLSLSRLSITIETVDIDSDSYAKRTVT